MIILNIWIRGISKTHQITTLKTILPFSILIALSMIAVSAHAGYHCKLSQVCSMVWSPGGSGTLTCSQPNWDCQWYPDASWPSPVPAPPPPPQPPTPPNPAPPAMTAEQKAAYCNGSPYAISADRTACQAEVDLMRELKGANCNGHGSISWYFSYIGTRGSVQGYQESEYNSLIECQGRNNSYAGYFSAQCSAEENRARGRAVSICGPINW